jgi:hypothetical protein
MLSGMSLPCPRVLPRAWSPAGRAVAIDRPVLGAVALEGSARAPAEGGGAGARERVRSAWIGRARIRDRMSGRRRHADVAHRARHATTGDGRRRWAGPLERPRRAVACRGDARSGAGTIVVTRRGLEALIAGTALGWRREGTRGVTRALRDQHLPDAAHALVPMGTARTIETLLACRGARLTQCGLCRAGIPAANPAGAGSAAARAGGRAAADARGAAGDAAGAAAGDATARATSFSVAAGRIASCGGYVDLAPTCY